jgi:hypothetical protein
MVLGAQTIVILVLTAVFTGLYKRRRFVAGTGLVVAGCLGLSYAPLGILALCQIGATASGTFANVPTIRKVLREKKIGMNSLVSAVFSFAGCAIRVFTTLELTQDIILLVGYIMATLVNGTLLLALFVYRDRDDAVLGLDKTSLAAGDEMA